jgi:hypothetical protein
MYTSLSTTKRRENQSFYSCTEVDSFLEIKDGVKRYILLAISPTESI